ncbi:MAG: M48 family metalloprotease [Phycisphaeraceae bacterium]|nr:M48 family metalloprotease [Phycisphaeraceae bacterium]
MVRMVNNFKTAMLLGGLMGLFLLVGSFYGQQGLIIALVFGLITNFGAWFFSDKIAIAAMQGREVTPDNGGDLLPMVHELSRRANLPMPRVFICPQEAPNAFATGRSPSKAAVAVTQGALRLLNREELAGVIGHELAHIKNRDTLTSTIAATISGVLAFIAQWGFLLGGRGGREGSNPLLAFLAIILAAVGAAVIKAMISRSREFVADHDGALIAGSPDGLIAALQKLDAYSQRIPMQNPNPAQNSMFIVEPLVGNSLLNLFASHPPTEARVEALRQMRPGN